MSVRAVLTLLAASALAAAAGAAPKPAAEAPATRDWTKAVALTAEGGFRMGNPAAPVKLVEYGSLTCPHCRDFSAAAKAPLAARVRTGKVSFEFRNMVLNGVDVAATLLARCGGAAGFFPLTERIYATQDQWTARLAAMTDAQKAELGALSPSDRLARIAGIAGLTQIAAASGIAPQRGKQCIADPGGLNRLGQMYEAATGQGINATPTFLINGKRVDAHSWAALEPLIKRAGG